MKAYLHTFFIIWPIPVFTILAIAISPWLMVLFYTLSFLDWMLIMYLNKNYPEIGDKFDISWFYAFSSFYVWFKLRK
jgi:hypothetical protein